MIETASTKSGDSRRSNIGRGAARFLLPLALAALLGALEPATLAGASLGTRAITAGSAAGSYSVVVTTTGAWTATANDSFLHTAASGTGNGLVVFTVDAFTGTGTRTGTLTIAGLNLAVTQVGTNYVAVNAVTTLVSGLVDPHGVAVDGSGNVYIGTFGNVKFVEWNAATGLTTLASSGPVAIREVALDGSGNVYIADAGYHAIKEWNAANGLTKLVSGLNDPWGVAVDGSGNVYIADAGDHAIKEWSASTHQVTTVASGGNGLSTPCGVAVDASANIYIADTGNSATKVWNSTTQNLTTLPNSSALGKAYGVAVDGSGNVYVTDTFSGEVQEWNAATQTVSTLVSSGLSYPVGAAVDGAGNVYIADSANDAIKKINIGFETLGTTSLLVASAAGSGAVEVSFLPVSTTAPWSAATTDSWLHITNATGAGGALLNFTYDANTTTTVRTGTITLDSGLTLTVTQVGTDYQQVTAVTTLVASGLNDPEYLAVDGSGNVFIADTQNNEIKEWNATTQGVTTLTPPILPLGRTGLELPTGVAVDGSANVYTVDHTNSILEWNATNGLTTILSLSSGLDFPEDLAIDRYGNLYTPNYNTSSLAEWSAATHGLTAVVGSGLSGPYGVAVDAAGNVYIADTGNNAIKEWNPTTGTLATLPNVSGLNHPEGVAVDGSGNVFIGDNVNNAVKEWNASTQTMATLVSTGLNGPMGVAVDGLGNIYIADATNSAIKELPDAFVGPASFNETAAAGSGSLLPVLPATQPLTGVYAPSSSDTSWLTITGVSGGGVNFSFAANTTTSARTANIVILGMTIPVTQAGGTTQTITFGALANRVIGTAPFAVSATATSGLAVSFASLTTSVCTVSGSTVTLVAGGKCTIEAKQGGGSGFAAATPVDQSFQVTPASQTITFGALGNRPFPATGTVALSATATSGLTVSFTSLTTSVCTVSGATVTLVAAGTCAIEATQAGSAFYAAAAAVDETFQVIQPALGTSAILVGSAASSSSVILSTLNAWTASSNASFLHISSGSASGTGSAVVVFTIDAFTGTGTRTGTLTVGGLTLTVTQAGTDYRQATGLTTLVPSTAGLTWPSDVAVDGGGNVFISDSRNNAIKEWSATAQTVSTLVSSGLADPQGLAVDGAGNVYIADFNNSAIKKWNTADGLVAVVSSGISTPYGVAVDAFGNIYVADSGNQEGKEWTASTGTLSTLVPSGMQVPWGAAVDSAGNFYVSDSNFSLITKWNAATQTAATLVSTNLNSPTGLAVDGAGNIYIANSDNSQIKEWNASTQKLTTLVSTGLNFPMGVAVDGTGNVYIADTFNNAIDELPYAFVGPVSMTERPAAGSDSLLQVLPATESLTGIFAPISSDTSWLTIGTIANGVVSFSFTANTGTSARTANITILGVTIPVTQLAAQTITFGALSNVPYGTAPFAISATASSGLAVSFASLTPSVCMVSSGTVTLVSVGTCTIEANQAGNTTYAPATPVDQSFQVIQGSQTISFGALSNVPYGTAPFAVSATATSGLAVSFNSLTTSVCTVSVATVTLVSGGACTIEATQAGNANYTAATAVDRSFTVTPAQPGLSISAPAVTYGVSASVGITVVTSLATVPTGTVTLAVDGGAGATKTLLGGAATFSLGVLAAGSHTLSVSYSGDTDYQAITAAQAATLLGSPVLVVNKASTAIALVVSGQTATAAVSVTPPGVGTPTGSVQFQRGTTVLGTVPLNGLMATLANVTAGAVTAMYSGDSNFSSSTSPGQTVYVPTSSVSITSSANPSTLGQSITFTAAITYGGAPPSSSATGTVQFFDGTTALGTASLSNGQATYTTATFGGGTHQISAKYSGDGVFPPAQATYQQVVSARTAVSLSVSPAAPALGDPVTVTATVTSVTAAAGFAAPTGTVTFVLGGTAFTAGTPVGTVTLSSGTASFTFTGLVAGGNEITAEYSGDGTWSASFLTIVVTVSGSGVKVGAAPSETSVSLAVVNGQLVLSATVTPAAAGPGTPTGSVQFIDTIDNSVVATATLSDGSASVSGVSIAAALPIEAVYSGDSNFQASTSTPLPAATSAAALLMSGFAPDEIASLYGVAGLSGNATGTLPLPTVLGGATVTITDSAGTARPAQLTAAFASASQINFVIPAGTANGFATVTITTPGGGTIQTVILVGTTAPGIFTANMTGKGVYAGQVVDGNPDGTQTILSPAVWDTVTNQYDAAPISLGPAGEQVYLVLYGTGLRQAKTVTASVNGVSLPVAFYGAQSQFPGLDQVNLEVPRSLAGAGLVNLAITVDGAAANTVTFDIE